MATGKNSDAQEQLAVDLWEAVIDDDVSKVRSLLGQGANPNHQLYWSVDWYQFWKKNRYPPVHEACKEGYLEITRALVSGGADVEKGGGYWGGTAFHYACRGGHKETVVYLSQYVNCFIDVRDKYSLTPLHYACTGGSIEVVQYLVIMLKCNFGLRDKYNQIPLHCACYHGHKDVVQWLVEECKCDVDMTDYGGRTPLDVAVYEGRTKVIDYLKSLRMRSTSESEPASFKNQSYLQKLDELLADKTNTIELQYLKMHFIGPSGVGKTTTRQRLVRSIINLSLLPEDQRKRCSTFLAECEQILAFVDKSGTKLEFKTSSNLEEETQFIFSYLMSCENSTISNISPPDKQPKKSQGFASSKETTNVEKEPLNKSDETVSTGLERQKVMNVSVTTVDVGKVVTRLRSIVGSGKYSKELQSNVLLNLVDIGGQPGFMEMFPFLSKGAGIFLSFFRLDKDLDDLCQVSYERGSDKITPYVSTYTSRETLSQVLSAISHYTKIDSDVDRELCNKLGKLGSAKPVATLIGTFKDELEMQIKVDLLYEKFCTSRKAVNKTRTTASKSDSTTTSKSDSITASETTAQNIEISHEQNKAIRNILTRKKYNDKQANVSAEDMAAIQRTVSQHLNSDAFKKDVKDRLEQKLEEKNEAVSTITSKFEDLLSNPKDRNFIPVDNYEGTDSDMDPLREHLRGILSSYFKDTNLRIRPQQLLFGVVLRKEFDIVSIEDCIRIGTEGLNMREEEVRFTVWYLDRYVGALIYQPEIKDKDCWFENFVICNPQVVFNSLSALVVKPLLELHSEESSIQFKETERKNWTLKGQFSLETITRCYSEENKDVKKGQLIPVEKLLILLEHSHLLATITTVVKNSHITEMVKIMYFMPAILKCASREELLKPSPPTGIDTPSPIKFTFDPQYVPIGIFCAMISELVSRGGKGILGMTWKLAADSSVKRNLVSFHIDESAEHFVTLIAHVDCYEVRVIRQDRKYTMHELCSYVLSTVLFIMKEISPLLSPIIAFDCYCGKHENGSKLCLLTQGLHPCFKCCTSAISLSPHQECWFANEASIGGGVSLLALPFASDLEDLEPSLAFKWSKRRPEISGRRNKLELKDLLDGHFEGFISCKISKNQKPFFTVYHCLKKSVDKAATQLDVATHGLPETVQQHETIATAVQLSQECSEEALLQLSTEIAGYNKYKHRLGVSRADLDEIDNDPRNFYSTQGKFYSALLKWKSTSIDLDNPSTSTATYGRLVEIAKEDKDGEAVRSIHKACIKHTSNIEVAMEI